MNLACITELPCPHQKDMEGIGCCMKDEGCCEYQLLEDNEDLKYGGNNITSESFRLLQ